MESTLMDAKIADAIVKGEKLKQQLHMHHTECIWGTNNDIVLNSNCELFTQINHDMESLWWHSKGEIEASN